MIPKGYSNSLDYDKLKAPQHHEPYKTGGDFRFLRKEHPIEHMSCVNTNFIVKSLQKRVP